MNDRAAVPGVPGEVNQGSCGFENGGAGRVTGNGTSTAEGNEKSAEHVKRLGAEATSQILSEIKKLLRAANTPRGRQRGVDSSDTPKHKATQVPRGAAQARQGPRERRRQAEPRMTRNTRKAENRQVQPICTTSTETSVQSGASGKPDESC